jgi:hypothetical protein
MFPFSTAGIATALPRPAFVGHPCGTGWKWVFYTRLDELRLLPSNILWHRGATHPARDAPMAVAASSPPEQGQLVSVRSRQWIVNDVRPSTLPAVPLKPTFTGRLVLSLEYIFRSK